MEFPQQANFKVELTIIKKNVFFTLYKNTYAWSSQKYYERQIFQYVAGAGLN